MSEPDHVRGPLPFKLEQRADRRYYVVWEFGETFADTPTLMLWERLQPLEAFVRKIVKLDGDARVTPGLQIVIDAAKKLQLGPSA